LKKGLVLRTDGAARGNPGPAGAGVVIEESGGEVLRELERYLGSRTNNQAEYEALLLGLRSLVEDPPRRGAPVTACLDSELVVRQLAGRYRVKDPDLRSLFDEAAALIARLPAFDVRHVPRTENRRADHLANRAIDSALERTEDANERTRPGGERNVSDNEHGKRAVR
jgi:ribonuclease HI